MELQDNQFVEVVLAIMYRKNHLGSYEFFLQQREDKENHLTLWEFPGGKVEENESHVFALYREVQEELNIDLTRIDKNLIHAFETFTYQYPMFTVRLHCYLVQYDFSEKKNNRWFLMDELMQEDFPILPGSKSIIKSLIKFFYE